MQTDTDDFKEQLWMEEPASLSFSEKSNCVALQKTDVNLKVPVIQKDFFYGCIFFIVTEF